MDLFSQFPCRCYDQSSDAPFGGSRRQAVEYGESECGRFARARLRQSQDIPAFHNYRDSLLLYGCGLGVAHRLDSGQDLGVKGKLLETHMKSVLLDCFTKTGRSQVALSAPGSRSIWSRANAIGLFLIPV